jgi:nucleoside-diphosphate-sugar epimerase
MAPKRVVVTGGSGHLGRPLLELLASDYDLVNADLTDAGPPADGSSYSFLPTDVMDLAALRTATEGADAVIHLAGVDLRYRVPNETFMRVNALGSWNVLQAAADNAVPKVVLCSSVAVFGLSEMRPDWQPATLPVDETHEMRPVHAYSLSKAIVEQMGLAFHRGHDMSVLCMRPLAVVDRSNMARFLATIDDPAHRWLFYYVTPAAVARGFRAALEAEGLGFETFLLGADDSCLAGPTLDWYQRQMGALPGQLDRARFDANPRASVFSSAKAQTLLGWRPDSNFLALRTAFEAG